LRGKPVRRDLFEHVEHALVARVIRVRSEIEAGVGRSAQRRRETTEKILRLQHGHALAMLGQREAGGEPADAAAEHDRMAQGDLLEMVWVRLRVSGRRGGRWPRARPPRRLWLWSIRARSR